MLSYPTAAAKQALLNDQDPTNDPLNQILYPLLNDKVPPEIIGKIGEFVEPRCDIKLEFDISEGIEYYFGDGEIGMLDSDFKILAAWKITQGLAFKSNLLRAIDDDEEALVHPLWYQPIKDGTAIFARMSPLDSIMVGESAVGRLRTIFRLAEQPSKQRLSAVIKKVEDSGLYNLRIPQTVNDFKTSIKLFLVNIQIILLVSGNLNAELDDSNLVPMYFRDDYYYEMLEFEGPDFLMGIDKILRGNTLEKIMQDEEVEYLYGPKTLEILELSGYSTVRNPNLLKFSKMTNRATRAKEPLII